MSNLYKISRFVAKSKQPNDIYKELEEYKRLSDEATWGHRKLYLESMWKRTKGEGVRVAVIDSGIDVTHPAFRHCITGGIDLTQFPIDFQFAFGINPFVNNRFDILAKQNGPLKNFYEHFKKYHQRARDIRNWGHDDLGSGKEAEETSGHGTFVSGIIAAKPIKDKFNNLLVSGVSPNVNLFVLKIAMRSSGGNIRLTNVPLAIDWCIANKIHIINCSFGGMYADEQQKKAFERAHKAGIIVVCSAGNANENPKDPRPINNRVSSPAKYPNTIAVAAIDFKEKVTSFSSRGPEIDFSAPGKDIWSTATVKQKSFWLSEGTSFSAPFITGSIALIMSAHKKRTGKFPKLNQVYKILKDGCVDLGKKGKDIETGWGFFTFNKAKFINEFNLSGNPASIPDNVT